MTKNDLVNIFKNCEIPSNEGIQYLETNDKLPRIVYFEYRWEDIVASGRKFDTNKLSSFFSFINTKGS